MWHFEYQWTLIETQREAEALIRPIFGGVVSKEPSRSKHNIICLSFYRHPALLLSHRPLGVCSFVTPWLAAKLLRTVYHVISGRLLSLLQRLPWGIFGPCGTMALRAADFQCVDFVTCSGAGLMHDFPYGDV